MLGKARLAGGWSSSANALADPRRYLQRRVVAYLRAMFWLWLALTASLSVLIAVFRPDPTYSVGAARLVSRVVPLLLLWVLWQLAARREQTERTLRVLEIIATVVPCALQLARSLFNSSTWLGLVTPLFTTACVGYFLFVRAAVVPSSTRTTLIVSASCLLPAIPIAYTVWGSPYSFGGMTGPQTAAVMISFLVLCAIAVAGIIGHIVHGLERTARNALQLGQYTLEQPIGHGGMGVVFKARHALLRRPTAVKLLPPDEVGDKAIARFEREVQHTSRLTHPNTVSIYDFGRTPDGIFYYAMEYLDGIDLDALVELDGPQAQARVIHVVAQAADALAEAHATGLIHRDIKPANIVLCQRGGISDTVKVLDFGLVKDVTTPPENAALTAEAAVMGTPLYLAPEALTNPESVDARTDIYGLGAVAYWLLTGEPVFSGRTVVEVCAHHLHTEPTPPSEKLGAPIDPELEALIMQCLEKDPKDRPTCAEALRAALLACPLASQWSRENAKGWWAKMTPRIDEVRGRPVESVGKTTVVAHTFVGRPDTVAEA